MVDEGSSLVQSNIRVAIESALKALVSTVPTLGGPLSSTWGDVQNVRKERRFLEFVEGIEQDLGATKQQVNETFVSHEDFLDLFEETARQVVVTRQEEKREALRRILAHAITGADVSYDEVEEFLRLAARLRPEHMLLLRILKDPVGYDEETGNRVGEGGGFSTSINQIMRKLLPDWDEATIVEVVSQLESERLIQNILAPFKTALTDRGIHHLEGTLTQKGSKFCAFVLE